MMASYSKRPNKRSRICEPGGVTFNKNVFENVFMIDKLVRFKMKTL